MTVVHELLLSFGNTTIYDAPFPNVQSADLAPASLDGRRTKRKPDCGWQSECEDGYRSPDIVGKVACLTEFVPKHTAHHLHRL